MLGSIPSRRRKPTSSKGQDAKTGLLNLPTPLFEQHETLEKGY